MQIRTIGSSLTVLSITTLSILISVSSSVWYAQSITELIKTSGMEIQEVAGIDITFPSRATPNPTQDITDLDYWLDILPYIEDKTAAGYVVYPKVGVIIPLVRPNNDDLEKIKVGELFDHYKYLEEWALHYVGAAPDQGIGNMVLAVHSSFSKTNIGRYKTAGQVAPLTNPWDKIFLYLANEQGDYTLYIYTTASSQEVPETQVSILDQQVSEKTLTLFTCYPIGTTDARRVNTATLNNTLSEEERTRGNAPTFTTQAVTSTPTPPQENQPTHDAAPVKIAPSTSLQTQITKSPSTKQQIGNPWTPTSPIQISPTFQERVLYRPVVYRTAINLVSTVGFKRSNLTKLTSAIDKKITSLSETTSSAEKNKKRIVLFQLIKELIEGFMH